MSKIMKRVLIFTVFLALIIAIIAGCSNATSSSNSNAVTITVKSGITEMPVTVNGGTIADAIKQAGFDMSKYDADTDINGQPQNGMVVTLKPKAENSGLVQETTKAAAGNNNGNNSGGNQPNSIVGNETDGFYYANADGVIDYGYCDGINIDGTDWNIINGKATVAETESDITLNRALKAVAKCTNSSMTKEEKLKAAFEYIKTAYLEGVLHDPPYQELDWPIVYANDIFVNGKGDCWSYGAAFAFMGKAIGCEDCYACNSGSHGWAEIEGLVYDPEWDMHYPEYQHFAVDYDNNDTDVGYKSGIEPGAPYMHVAV